MKGLKRERVLAGAMDAIFPKEHTGEKFRIMICKNIRATPRVFHRA